MLRRRTVCVLEVAARANGPYRLATEVGIQGPSAVRQIQELGLISRLWPRQLPKCSATHHRYSKVKALPRGRR
jgi:hypothetical protein